MSPVARSMRRGVTLIEAVLYISIALALIVGGLVFFQQASLASRTQATVRLGSALIQETRALYSNATDLVEIPVNAVLVGFLGEVGETLIAAGAVPSSAVRATSQSGFNSSTSRIVTAWGTPVNIFVGRRSGSPVVQIAFTDIPSSACVRLATTSVQRTNLLTENVDFVLIQDRTSGGGTSTSTRSPANGLSASVVGSLCDLNGNGQTTGLLIQASL
jgi:hypothetical protein